MATLARSTFLLLVALAVGCSTASVTPQDPEPPTLAGPDATDPGTIQDANLLRNKKRNQLLLDLDRYTEEWQVAREKGRVAAYGGLERLLRRMVDENLELIVQLTADPSNPRARIITSKALGFSSPPETGEGPPKEDVALKALAALLDEDDPVLLENALMGVALRADARFSADKVAFHLDSFESRVQRNAALALYRLALKGSRPTPAFLEPAIGRLSLLLLDPSHAVVRGNAAAALGVLGGADNEDDILNLLEDPEPYPRLRAIVALARIGTEKSVDPLLRTMAAPEPNISHRAAQSLWIVTRRLGYGIDGDLLGNDPEPWRAAIDARREEIRAGR
jgi:HEAT repeat protein